MPVSERQVINDFESHISWSEEEIAVREKMEREFPTLCNAYRDISENQYRVFLQKQHDYGLHNIDMGEDVTTDQGKKMPLLGLMIRLRDKIERIKTLTVRESAPRNESMMDTYLDISNYGIIAQMVAKGLWKRG